MSWKCFNGNRDGQKALTTLPEPPPWRVFLPRNAVGEGTDKQDWDDLRALAASDNRSIQRGQSFRVLTDKDGSSEIVDAVNAAIHLRRPLLVTGAPGSGKTSLVYAIAYELQLGPVLTWPITARANLTDALYRYDAIARLQDTQLDKSREGRGDKPSQEEGDLGGSGAIANADTAPSDKPPQEEGDLGDYIQLGPVGTAFLPSLLPRVLLIDEIDKSDLNLPNDLLNLFEEGEFEIPELVRRKRRRGHDEDAPVMVRTADKDREAPISKGRVKCCEFPLVIMTSNGERDFPPAFYRRCLRVKMPNPTAESLLPIVQSHFDRVDANGWTKTKPNLTTLIDDFLGKKDKADRATDQLLNAIYLMTRAESPDPAEMKRLQALLFKRLGDPD